MVAQQIVAPPAKSAIFMVLTVRPGSEKRVRSVLADVAGMTRSVSFRVPDDRVMSVVGIGAKLWDRLFDLPRPAHLREFQEIKGAKHVAVATAGDVLIHVRGDHLDACFALVRNITRQLGDAVDVVDEVHGFKFFDDRDLLGFVDGSENPEGQKACAAVTIGDEDPAYAGGSYVIVQKYLHDMAAWESLSVEDQERVVGRSKLDNIEMPDDVKPSNSHVALNTIEDEHGVQQQIVRDNLPFGRIGEGEFGTYFIGYARDPRITEQMLHNMFIGKPEGNYDRILDFSTAKTGSMYFVPSEEFLDQIS